MSTLTLLNHISITSLFCSLILLLSLSSYFYFPFPRIYLPHPSPALSPIPLLLHPSWAVWECVNKARKTAKVSRHAHSYRYFFMLQYSAEETSKNIQSSNMRLVLLGFY